MRCAESILSEGTSIERRVRVIRGDAGDFQRASARNLRGVVCASRAHSVKRNVCQKVTNCAMHVEISVCRIKPSMVV